MISYTEDISAVKPEDLSGFFEGWSNPPSTDKRYLILQNSHHVLLALEGSKPVGFITAITDKTISAYIPFVEVLPVYRGKGVGKELVRRMMDRLSDLYMIDLCCDEELEKFYENFGMLKVSGMIKRNYDKI
ncbi:MAG: GNAT family N-acetyltransferase [Ignavibacteria bacterium]|nr:GNAT family N-acetyltransferase [Ignavibacteria bacterium]